jgi:hypothetical protein
MSDIITTAEVYTPKRETLLTDQQANAANYAPLMTDRCWTDSDELLGRFSDHPPLIVSFHNEPTASRISDLYTGKFDFRNFNDQDRDKLVGYIKTNGQITTRTAIDDDLIVEPPKTVEQAFIGQMDFYKVVIITQDETVDFSGITEGFQRTMEAAAKVGLGHQIENQMAVFSDQVPLTESYMYSDEGMVFIGVKGISDTRESDAPEVFSHEAGHAQIYEELKRNFDIDPNKISYEDYLCPTFNFWSEGVAVFVASEVGGHDCRQDLLANYPQMYHEARSELESGTYTGKYESNKVISYFQSQDKLTSMSNIHSRMLPGAVIQYCAEKGIKVHDLIKTQVDNFQPTKQSIADEYQISPDLVSGLSLTTLDNINATHPENVYPAVDADTSLQNSQKILNQLIELARAAHLQPFEVLARIQGNTPAEASQDFLQWLNG